MENKQSWGGRTQGNECLLIDQSSYKASDAADKLEKYGWTPVEQAQDDGRGKRVVLGVVIILMWTGVHIFVKIEVQ
jgi:hypothetical protein